MFDFTHHMTRLVRDMVRHTPELHHIDCERIVLSVSQQRKFGSSGLYAKVVPLRFDYGRMTTQAHGCHWAVPTYLYNGREALYIVSFCLPRFMNIKFEDKGETIFHELFHISPKFDGDLRRFPGRNYQHGPDPKAYDAHMRRLFRRYLQQESAPHLLQFLRSRFHHIEDRFGAVLGLFAPTPAPVRVNAGGAPLPPEHLRVMQRVIASARSQRRASA